jgi:hypothetical protein
MTAPVGKPKRRRGMPSRAEATRRALALLEGLDPSSIDPEKVLAAIAVDTSAPASARVAAARALLTLRPALPSKDKPKDQNDLNAAANQAATLMLRRVK